jgi:hypothetical protein
MLIPTITIHISGTVLAVYGAILSTITGAVQIITHFRDRAHLRVRAQHNMKMHGDPRYAGKTLTLVSVVNAGRRPVTVRNIGAFNLCPEDAFVIMDTRPALPCELTEGKEVTAILDQQGVDLSVVESWEAYTVTGKTLRQAVVPWYRRWWNRRQLRKHYRRTKK